MRQGSRLGPLSFIVMIDDLRANCEVHKFVDDTTLSELIIPSSSPSNMTDNLSSLLIWTFDNNMQVNTSKTKEMILGRIDSMSIASLSTPAGSIQPASYLDFTLMRVYPGPLTSIALYPKQVNDCRPTFSNKLRAGIPPQQLLHFYTAVIRPVLEYASPVWHYSITRAQSQRLESIQKRAVHIIFSFTRGMSYPNVLFVANLNSLKDRRDKLVRSLFQSMCKLASCLHRLLPSRNTSAISRLRSCTSLPRPTSGTK